MTGGLHRFFGGRSRVIVTSRGTITATPTPAPPSPTTNFAPLLLLLLEDA